ncbi:MAG: hypothetical protein AAF702_47010 [Chloroflexota bacterium]
MGEGVYIHWGQTPSQILCHTLILFITLSRDYIVDTLGDDWLEAILFADPEYDNGEIRGRYLDSHNPQNEYGFSEQYLRQNRSGFLREE